MTRNGWRQLGTREDRMEREKGTERRETGGSWEVGGVKLSRLRKATTRQEGVGDGGGLGR